MSVATLEGASHFADQFLCIDRSTSAIYVGQLYTNLIPEPLQDWRARHGALTDRGVVLNPLLPKAANANSEDKPQNTGSPAAASSTSERTSAPAKYAVAVAARAPIASGSAACFDVAKQEPGVLRGKLLSAVFAGPPNYEDVRKGDSPETAYVLQLASRICIADSENGGASRDVSMVQLYPRNWDPATWAQMRSLIGVDVQVELSSAQAEMTGHDHEPLVAGVSRIAPTSDVALRPTPARILQTPTDTSVEQGTAATTVRAFYEALSVGNGEAANLLVVPEKRASGAFAADRISQFYGPMVEPLQLIAVTTQSAGEYLVSYRFKAGARVCAGRAVVSTAQREGLNLIDKIHPLDGC